MFDDYKVPSLRIDTPIQILATGRSPYGHWLKNSKNEEKKRSMRKLGVALIEIALIATVIAAIIIGINCALPAAHASEAGFPSYWKMDNYWTEWVQNYLVEWGYDVAIDGQFGPKTAQTVKEFQYDQGLAVTGVVDEAVAKKLGFELESGRTLYYMADLDKIAAKSKGNYLIYVALGGRSGISHIGVFQKQKGDWKLIKSEDCLPGEQVDNEFTFLGKTTVDRKMGQKIWITDEGYVYMYHKTLNLKDPNTVIYSYLQTGAELNETQVQKSCVHVSTELAEWLMEYIPVGTTVVIDDRAWQPSDIT